MIEPQLLPCATVCGYKLQGLAVYPHPRLSAHQIRSAFGIQSNICNGAFLQNGQRIKVIGYFRKWTLSWMFDGILNATLPKNSLHLHQNWRHSLECLPTFPEIFEDIPLNVWGHSPECFRTFLEIFGDIPQMFSNIPCNVSGHSPEYLGIFPEIFEDIPRNVWRHSLEYNILSISHVSRISFRVPIFLVLQPTELNM